MTEASWIRRLRQRVAARFARPTRLWLDESGQVRGLDDAASQPWLDWVAEHPGTAVDLIVPAALQYQLLCEAGLPLDDDAALSAYARQQFAHYFGAAAQRWALAPWRSGQRSGAVALHGLELTALLQPSEAGRVELRSLRPAWAVVLQWLAVEQASWLQSANTALAWVEGPLLTWLRLEQGECIELRQLRLREASPQALGESLNGLNATRLNTLVMGHGLQGDLEPGLGLSQVGRLDAVRPATAWFSEVAANKALPQPDFLSGRLRTSAVAWPLALAGALSLAVAGWDAWGSFEARQEAQWRLSRLTSASASTSRAASSTKPAPQAAVNWAAAREAKAQMDFNWEAALSDVERVAASGEVSWLGLDARPARADLVLEGLAKDKRGAIQAAQQLGSSPGWASVLVRQVQMADGGQQRFELGAKLQASQLRGPAVLGAPK